MEESGTGSAARRHGCVTLWLAALVVTNLLAVFGNLARGGSGWRALPGASVWPFTALSVLALANIIFAVALLRWRRWGFYGFCVTALAAAGINLFLGLPLSVALANLLGVGILFLLLHVGGSGKTWPRLR